MEAENFVNKIRQSVIDENTSIYKDLFETTAINQANDPYWQEALKLFGQLDDVQKETLFKIMRQVSVDTVSNIFAILDGVSSLENQDGEFTLSLDGDSQKLNGDLQDIFLSLEEG